MLSHNNIWGQMPTPKNSTPNIHYLGLFHSLGACMSACLAMRQLDESTSCTSFTWHHADYKADWALQCYGRVDNIYNPVPEHSVDSGRIRR
jgi:hypothetical protein